FTDIPELPDSLFAADDEAIEIPELDFGHDVPQSILADESIEAPDFSVPSEEPVAVNESPSAEKPIAPPKSPSERGSVTPNEVMPVVTPVTPYRFPRPRPQQVETIEPAEATPESAQPLDDAIATPAREEVGTIESVELSDSTFGRAVNDFAGESTGPIV